MRKRELNQLCGVLALYLLLFHPLFVAERHFPAFESPQPALASSCHELAAGRGPKKERGKHPRSLFYASGDLRVMTGINVSITPSGQYISRTANFEIQNDVSSFFSSDLQIESYDGETEGIKEIILESPEFSLCFVFLSSRNSRWKNEKKPWEKFDRQRGRAVGPVLRRAGEKSWEEKRKEEFSEGKELKEERKNSMQPAANCWQTILWKF